MKELESYQVEQSLFERTSSEASSFQMKSKFRPSMMNSLEEAEFSAGAEL